MSVAPLTPETEVWVSTPRARIAYHLLAGDGRGTVCGRYIGQPNYAPRGHVMPLADAVMRFDSAICQRCAGTAEVVAPRSARSRDRGRG